MASRDKNRVKRWATPVVARRWKGFPAKPSRKERAAAHRLNAEFSKHDKPLPEDSTGGDAPLDDELPF